MYLPGHIRQLECGFSFSLGGFTGGYGLGDNRLRPDGPGWYEACAGWQILQPQIMRDWLQRENGIGRRPWAWWHIDKRERRLRIDGKPHPHDNHERNALVAERAKNYPNSTANYMKLYYGVPGALMIHDDFEAEYEEEFEYLERHDLWLPGELQAGVPLLAAAITKLRASMNDSAVEPSAEALDRLRRFDAALERLSAKLGTVQ